MAKKPNFDAQPNPALAFISHQEPPKAQEGGNQPPAGKKATEAAPEAPEGYRIVPEKKDGKSKNTLIYRFFVKHLILS